MWRDNQDSHPVCRAARATRAALVQGAEVVFQGAFLSGTWGGWSDFLMRVDKPSALGPFSYEVADFRHCSAPPPRLIQIDAESHPVCSEIRRGLTAKEIIDLRRRSALEAEIGQMETEGRLSRYLLKGAIGDAVFAILNACGHNIRKILAHVRAWLAWIIAVLCIPEIPQHQRYVAAEPA